MLYIIKKVNLKIIVLILLNNFINPMMRNIIIEPYKKQTIKVTINNFIDSKYIPK